jgi:tungstate transport system ATP-binding protein
MKPLFILKSVQKRYNQGMVLDLQELEIHAGRIYSLTGPNGAGKSTLLHILAFLSTPSAGQLFFEGSQVDWNSRRVLDLRKSVTLLHQTPYLFAGTVFDNVAFGLKARNVPRGELRELVAEALEMVGLSGFEERNARSLSGGETQRVALARALALKPKVLLLDEPLSNVDRQTAELLERVLTLLPSRGTTVVMATHDPLHPQKLDSSTIHLVEGRLAA